MNDDDLRNYDGSLELPVVSASPDSQAQNGTHSSHHRALPRNYLYAAIFFALTVVILGVLTAMQLLEKDTVAPMEVTINTQSLDNGTLNKLTPANGDTPTRQQLTITPDTIFKNNAEVQGALEVDKDITTSGDVNIRGSSTLQGGVSINNNLSVRGSISATGSVSAASLNIGTLAVTSVNASGNITLSGHIIPNGATPTSRVSSASNGGSIDVSGNDTAGTVTITTGPGTVLPGEAAIITFRVPFSTTPKVQLTPINAQAAGVNYYATRGVAFFTIETTTALAPNTRYVFDYLVTQ